MLKKFKTKELVYIAIVSAFMFVIGMALGTFLVALTGVPMMGGLIINCLLAYLLVLSALIIRKFGTLTLITLIYSLLSVPTINFGPPGFYKVILALSMGLLMDIILAFGRYKRWIYYAGAGFIYFLITPYMLWVLTLFGMPLADKLAQYIIPFMFIYLIQGLFGAWLACWTYDKKLKHLKIIKTLQS